LKAIGHCTSQELKIFVMYPEFCLYDLFLNNIKLEYIRSIILRSVNSNMSNTSFHHDFVCFIYYAQTSAILIMIMSFIIPFKPFLVFTIMCDWNDLNLLLQGSINYIYPIIHISYIEWYASGIFFNICWKNDYIIILFDVIIIDASIIYLKWSDFVDWWCLIKGG